MRGIIAEERMNRAMTPLAWMVLLVACDGPGGKDTGNPNDSGDSGDSVDSGGENGAPNAPVVAITPAHPADDDALTVTILTEATDPDGDALTYTYAWSKDGVDMPTLTSTEVGADQTADGETWQVSVTANDGTVSGPTGTAAVTIGNAPPSAPVIHIAPEAPVTGDDLTLFFDTQAADPEGDALTQTIQWFVDDAYNVSLDGALGVDGRYVDSGEVWVVEVSVTDGAHDPVRVSTSVTVSNRAPELDTVEVVPNLPEDSDTLSARANATDPDGDAITYSFRWFRDGAEAVDVGDVDTVPASATAANESWWVEVTASDGHLSDTMESGPVTIAEGTSVRLAYRASLLVAPDGAGGWAGVSGTTSVTLNTTGVLYGVTDCDVWWVLSTLSTRACRGCDFAFNTTYTYDAASSTIGTPLACSTLEVDSTGAVEYSGRELMLELRDPAISVYYYGYPYTVYAGLYAYAYYGSYGYSYYGSGYGYAYYNSLTSYEDPYGYLHMEMYRMQYYAE